MSVRRVLAAFFEVVAANKARFALIAALVLGAAAYGSKALKIYEFAARWISGHITVTNGAAHPQTPLVLLVCTAAGLAIVLLIACALLLVDSVQQRLTIVPRTQALQNAFDVLMQNSQLIVNQTYPATPSPLCVVDKVSLSAFVAANGDVTLEREDHVRTEDQPLHYWTQHIEGEETAPPVDFVEQLGLTLEDATPWIPKPSVVYLVLNNKGRSKDLAVFHLPKIEPSEQARIVKTRFTWPAMSTMLKTKQEEWGYTLRSKKPVPTFELTVRYAKSFGEMKCEVVSTKLAEPQKVDDAAGNGWRYTVKNSDGQAEHVLRFSRV